MKKFILFVILIVISFLTSCFTVEDMILLPDLAGKNRLEITNVLTDLKVNFDFLVKKGKYSNEAYDKFIEYGQNLKAGDEIKSTQHIFVYTSVLPLTLNRLDEVILDDVFVGKSFLNDNIGLVVLNRTIDGDTADFLDIVTMQYIRVRFLGIDTPESTSKKEPWGQAASSFTSDKLRNAKQIVLVGEGPRTDTYGRYLAWVWIDGQLLNLEIVQQAYSGAKVSSSSKYFNIFNEIEQVIIKTGRRVWGEDDPNYKYS